MPEEGRKDAGLWLEEVRVELGQKCHYSSQPLPKITEQNNYSQIRLCLGSEENPLSSDWDSSLLCVQASARSG